MNRPPLRRCPRCGRRQRAWRDETLCRACLRETAPDAAQLRLEIEEQRAGRLERLGVDPQPVRHEHPTDDIPY